LRSPFLPIFLLGSSLFIWSIFQTSVLLKEREDIAATRGAQVAPLVNTTSMRKSYDALISEIRKVASSGNTNAQKILDAFERQGIHLDAVPNNSSPLGVSGSKAQPPQN